MPKSLEISNPSGGRKTKGFQGLLAQASRAVAHLCSASDECIMRLDQIEEEMEETSDIEGVRILRFRLGECLQKLREETRRQREGMSQALARLHRQVQAAEAGASQDESLEAEVDKVSGLDSRECAERSLLPPWSVVGYPMPLSSSSTAFT